MEGAHWDVDEFYEVSNETHNSKANSDCPTDLNELCNYTSAPYGVYR